MKKLGIKVGGMSCGHCVGAVTGALKTVDGVTIDEVRIGLATISYDPARTSPAAIARAIEAAGYETAPASLPE